jgi:hypothetical protein
MKQNQQRNTEQIKPRKSEEYVEPGAWPATPKIWESYVEGIIRGNEVRNVRNNYNFSAQPGKITGWDHLPPACNEEKLS